MVPEEATRDVAGSPYVPYKRAEEIRGSDIFIADITRVAQTATGKSVPNPNVAYELGLAAAHLGWDRIVLLFNRAVASLKDLPFDFYRHRISTYRVIEAVKIDGGHQKALSSLVTVAVPTIIDQNPPRSRDLEGKSEAEVKKARDVVNLRWFLRHMSVDLLGMHVRAMPDRLHYFAAVMNDGRDAVVSSPSFRLYDDTLEKRLRSLVGVSRHRSVSHLYRDTNSRWVQAPGLSGPHRDFAGEAKAATELKKVVAGLARELDRVVEVVRNDYIEIDLDETSRHFGKEYADIVKSV